MLAEQEITTMLNLVQEIRDHLGITPHDDVEIARQSKPMDVKTLSTELDRHLPSD